ncbi:DUF1697 domain-containing protein [Bizionia paragorgiae]|nr:DUF1697 domain-containing protein [Bizionia paragorgiae]
MMIQYVALLRGINVGGHKKILMADLRASIENVGFKNVQSYIQSGNIIFESALPSKTHIESVLKQAILKGFGYDVPLVILTKKAFNTVVNFNPIDAECVEKSYFSLLASKPPADTVLAFNNLRWDKEWAQGIGVCVYSYFNKPYSKVKCTGSYVEKYFGIETTTRNYRTMKALQKMLHLE